MTVLDAYQELLRCPECSRGCLTLLQDEKQLQCSHCVELFPVVNGCPVLLKSTNQLFSVGDYVDELGRQKSGKTSSDLFRKLIPTLSVNMASERVLSVLRQKLSKKQHSVVLVVGGGRQREWLDKLLRAGERIDIVYSDIDVNANVDLICDGHVLPFVDSAFDSVITTAVLEHVLYPEQVAEEIHRVLKVGGLFYSELPFMQQVHEGAYDFTRYTLSGHRRLFNKIEEIESGMIAGPATAMTWAIENFALAFVRNNNARRVTKIFTRLLFAWLKYIDYLLKNRPEAMDGASCTYILGRRVSEKLPDKKIIASYVGSKHLSHT